MKIKVYSVLILLLISSTLYGQSIKYNYQRELNGVADQWHKFNLPNDMYSHLSNDLSDIRILGITNVGDTIEAPYLIRQQLESSTNKVVKFEMLNSVYNKQGYYFTFEIPSVETINHINLGFQEKNFDWRLKLEASHNQGEWFTIVEDYRILSIKNSITDYNFTKVKFQNSKYKYYRILINSDQKPELNVANVFQAKVVNGEYRLYSFQQSQAETNHKSKKTTLDINLEQAVLVSQLKMNVTNDFDFYRPISIQYLSDSVKTEKGWKYSYSTLFSGTLTSLEKQEFKFNATILKRLRIVISNGDNQPLSIGIAEVEGPVNTIVARFTTPADYYLVYGNKMAIRPNYDIAKFTNKIPNQIKAITLGKVQSIDRKMIIKRSPLFENKLWLWTIMGLTIGVLAWFSVKMLKKAE